MNIVITLVVIIVIALLALFLTKHMPSANTVQVGNTISVDYIGKTTDGKIFDTSIEQVAKDNGLFSAQRPYTPLSFTVGSGQMIAGFDKGVVGMHVGETKELTLAPQDAYGEVNPALVKTLSGSMFTSAGITPKVGETYMMNQGMSATVKAISGDDVTMDFNPPLAGKTLIFEVTLKSIGTGANQ